MERTGLGKSKDFDVFHSDICAVEQIQTPKSHASCFDDSASSFDGNKRNPRSSLEKGRNSTGRSTARPMVKMLTQLYKGMKRKRKSASLITRLLGLDQLQSQRPVDGKHKGSPDSYPLSDASIEIEGHRPHCDGQSEERTSMKQREVEDLYEDKDPSYFMNRRFSSRWRTANSLFSRSDKNFSSHKFKDARKISKREQLWISETIDDASCMNKGSSLARTLNDVHVNNHLVVLKPSNSGKYGLRANARLSERGSSSEFRSSFIERKDGFLLDPNYRYIAHSSHIVKFEDWEGKEMNSSGVEFLNQTLNTMQISCMTGSCRNHSNGSLRNFRRVDEKPSGRNMCRATRHARDAWKESCLLEGYAGDVSSFESQESDSDNELEMSALPSRNLLRTISVCHRYPSSGSVDCNDKVSRNKSEIWNITEHYQDLEIVYRDSTPHERLANRAKQSTSMLLNSETCLGSEHTKHGCHRGINTIQEAPSYVSRSDGGKDEIHGTFSRFMSVPAVASSSSSNTKHAYDDLFVGKKVENGNPYCPCHQTKTIDFSVQAEFELQMEPNVKNVYKQEQQLMGEVAAKDDSLGGTGCGTVVSEQESTTTLSFKSFLLDPGHSSGGEEDKDDICNLEDISLQVISQKPPIDPHEKDEFFSQKDPMDYEDFDRLNDVFHELRMQLLLLYMNSVISPEVSIQFPLKKHIAKLSSIFFEGNNRFDSESWEVSYLTDVIIHSGLQESGLNILKLTWHSPDSPLDPNSFDDLEKIYGDVHVGSMPERKLLFDRINLALFDMFLQHINLFPWVMPRSLGLCKEKQPEWDILERMINRECAIGKAPESIFDRDMQWSDEVYRAKIDNAGMEIEMMLIGEMIDEFIWNL